MIYTSVAYFVVWSVTATSSDITEVDNNQKQ